MTEKQTPKPQFIWHKVESELRIKKSSQYLKIPLKATVNFALQEPSHVNIQTRLHIDIQKSLQFQNSIGWNWHKSSNLPVFSLKLSILKGSQGSFINPPQQLQANMYAVKIVQNTFQKDQNLYLEDIGIKGESQIKLIDGCGCFNSLKFSSTSYNNEGVKFHLLIVVFKNDDQSEIPQNIICTVISPPIFVDSRKSARNYQEKKYLSFVELFNPDQLQKLFTKRDNKELIEQKKIISNNDEGLYNYLTAPNIRHKVKHPLFLSVRFSNVFKIFFNPNSRYFSEKQISLGCILTRLQKKLIKEVGILRRTKHSQSIEDKQFAICLHFESMAQKEKILDMLEYLDCQSICLIEDSEIFWRNFIDISEIGDIVEAYKNQYCSLKKKSQKEITEMKNKRTKNQDEENSHPEQYRLKEHTLFQKILKKDEDKFSISNLSQNENPRELSLSQKVENRSERMRALGLSLKKIKINENQLVRNEQFMRYPLHEHLEQRFIQERQNLENYQHNSLNFFGAYGSGVNKLVKTEQGLYFQYVSREQVEEKIKEMCVQVYQRNKKSILHYLQALKKSNIKWKVKDVEQFIFSYSTALMDAIHYRERLLHHMFLENQILKAKVGIMQEMALTDLNKIKGNIFSMNKYLPEKFIIQKLKQNSLWNEEITEKEQEKVGSVIKMASVKEIQVSSKPSPTEKKNKKKNLNITPSDKMIEEASSSEMQMEGSLECDCKFTSNVFEIESPSLKQ